MTRLEEIRQRYERSTSGDHLYVKRSHSDIPYLLALAEAAEKMSVALEDIKLNTRRRQLPLTALINDTADSALAAYHRAREGQ